ncbi:MULTISPECIES: DUF4251 domain-containing protein [unclassified Carboxylicivirga]|uniref:DUF4251 domain-containing protein n=1 Tax=Carboxylicivirga TaxID=1628153 RepID=UPI003D32D218
MKKLALFSLLVAFSLLSMAQENQTEKMTRKERRALQKQEQAERTAELSKLLEVAIDEQQWVLEANVLQNKRGASVNVNSNLNFIAVEGDEAFVQLGSSTGMGQNGVGGVSVRGRVSKYEVKKNDKKGTYFITVYITSALGSFDIRLDSNASGQIANASVQGNTSRRVQYRGILLPVSMSNVYKGTPII